jgi:hypothetical protein
LDAAWELAQKAIKLDSNFPDPYFILGEIATQRNNHKKAFGFFWLEANLREKVNPVSLLQGSVGQWAPCPDISFVHVLPSQFYVMADLLDAKSVCNRKAIVSE